MKSLYLRVGKYNGYDDFYFPLDEKERTWKEVLDKVESVLDERFIDNDNCLVGINLSIEIVDTLPADIDVEF